MLLGYNLANSSTCLPHRLQYALGAITGSAHGVGLAALYPAWVRTTYEASKKRFDDLAGWIGGDRDGGGEYRMDRAVDGLLEALDLNPTLRGLGADEHTCARMAGMVTGSLAADPWGHDGADLAGLYRASLDGPGGGT